MTAWLKCAVREGIFSRESTVSISRGPSGEASFIVPRSEVKGIGSTGRVRVRLLDRRDGKWAVVPSEYRDVVPVQEEDVTVD